LDSSNPLNTARYAVAAAGTQTAALAAGGQGSSFRKSNRENMMEHLGQMVIL
jgi:hypothetical protein